MAIAAPIQIFTSSMRSPFRVEIAKGVGEALRPRRSAAHRIDPATPILRNPMLLDHFSASSDRDKPGESSEREQRSPSPTGQMLHR